MQSYSNVRNRGGAHLHCYEAVVAELGAFPDECTVADERFRRKCDRPGAPVTVSCSFVLTYVR